MKFLFIFLFCFFSIVQAQSTKTIKVVIEQGVLRDYKIFIKDKNPLEVNNFKEKGTRRSVVELVLLQQALHKGGYEVNIEFMTSPTSSRELLQIKDASAITAATSLWLHNLETISDFIYISDPLIRNEEFEAGLYTVHTNKKVLSMKTIEEIQTLTAISNKNWIPDWHTLEELKLKKVLHTLKWKSMTRMINANRGDFLLAEFQSTPDLSFKTEDIKFLPIPNLKVGLKGSRHFAISKKYKDSKKIFLALNKGLKILRKEGKIKKAYIESSFFNVKVKHWKKLN